MANPTRMAGPDIAVETDLGYRDFVRNHLRPRRPVLLKGAMKRIPAGGWTPESLEKRFGDKRFRLDGQEVRFGDFIQRVVNASPDDPPPYLRNVGVEQDFEELIPDLEPGLPYARSNWRFSRYLPAWWFRSKTTFCQFFFTGPGRGFPFMHVDYPPMHTFSALSYGRKEWVLFGPDQTPHLYAGSRGGWEMVSGVENPFEPDLEKYPDFARAEGSIVMQEAGDVLFVPSGWWHTTRSHSPTIAVAWDHLSASSWKPFVTHKLKSEAFTNKSGLYQAAVSAYLALIGAGLKVKESLGATLGNDARPGRIV